MEAARAGEAGKGFAVVAEEVRNLAQRSAEAARNTADLIDQSMVKTETGVGLTEQVASILEEIRTDNKNVADLVSEIAAASGEQAQGIDQINTAVTQIESSTQSNAVNAEESSSAAEELSAQALTMNDLVMQLERLVGGTEKACGKTSNPGTPADRGDADLREKKKGVGRASPGTGVVSSNHDRTDPESLIPFEEDEALSRF